ncbi:IclR family transcriptional regulator [Orrella marina]|uniref:IclR family transcriptional regulator n=1 Tax=Orrella marina TaxID=2163011 RepID=A0A2R4XID5_9BURK|nr:helix-turn-helix domain-containing protein [Orrella marina]AWB33587.1 IclR family transcriptional regulator [Orrella marina]
MAQNIVPQTPTKEVGAVVNAVHILRFLASQTNPQSVTTTARATGVSPSTTFNILRTLASEGMVRFNESTKTYSLGLGLSELAVNLIGQSHADLIQPELDRLALNLQILTVLWRVTSDRHISMIASATPRVPHVAVRKDSRLPELVGAVGRCIAAARNLPVDTLRRHFSGIRWDNPPDFDRYLADVEKARAEGWAIDEGGLYHGVSLVGSAITDQHGKPRFALSGIAISTQQNNDSLLKAAYSIRETALYLQRSLFPRSHEHSRDIGH